MAIKLASFVQVRKGTKLGHMGPQDYFKVEIVSQDYTFEPNDPTHGSLTSAFKHATKIAEALELEVVCV